MILPILLANRQIVDAGVALRHQAVFLELPVLVAIGAKPIARIVMPFVGEANRDSILVKRPEFFDQTIVKFARPLAAQEGNDLLSSVQKL
jgi:hypothetical protein